MSRTLSEKIVMSVGTGEDPAEITVLDTLDNLTATAEELNALAGVTAGTATASKALVIDANKAIATITTGTITNLTTTTLTIGSTAVTATAAEINQKCDNTNQAVTTTADGTTTGAILPTSNFVLITSSAATNQAALPGIAANSLPVGHVIRGFVTANGLELITLATTNETINNVDSDGTNQLDIPANTAFEAWVVSATGWAVLMSATATPDND